MALPLEHTRCDDLLEDGGQGRVPWDTPSLRLFLPIILCIDQLQPEVNMSPKQSKLTAQHAFNFSP